MPTFMLAHRHDSDECRTAFAAWKGFDSPLRRAATLGSCIEGGHTLWWTVEAQDEAAALALLPPFLADRTAASRVSEIPIP